MENLTFCIALHSVYFVLGLCLLSLLDEVKLKLSFPFGVKDLVSDF